MCGCLLHGTIVRPVDFSLSFTPTYNDEEMCILVGVGVAREQEDVGLDSTFPAYIHRRVSCLANIFTFSELRNIDHREMVPCYRN